MFWIWLLTRNTHKWSTGPLERYFIHLCQHCGASTPAMVRTFGNGGARSPWNAQQAAFAAANVRAIGLVAATGCPACGKLQPSTLAQWARAQELAARSKKLALPVAGGLALLVALLLAIPAIGDLRHSLAMSVVACSAAIGSFCVAFGLISRRAVTPFEHPHDVMFSLDPSQGPGSWFCAQPGDVPRIVQPSAALRTISLIAAGMSGVLVIGALVVWSRTFRKVYVINTAARHGDMVVRIDGAEAGRVSASARTKDKDVAFETFEVRTGSWHRLVVIEPDGAQSGYDIDPATTKHGWVIAPRARQRDLCITSLTWYYGTAPNQNANDRVLNVDGVGDRLDVVKYDFMFTPPPDTIQTKSSSETRTTLRALACSSLDREETVPFGDGPIEPPQ